MAGEQDDELIVHIEDGDGTTDGGDQVILVDQTGLTDGTRGTAQVRKEMPDDPVETLKAQLAEKDAEVQQATQRASNAERLASQHQNRATVAEREAEAARTEAANSTRGTIDAGIAAAKAEADSAESDYNAAFDAGDGKAMAKAHRRMARAEAEAIALEQAKAEMGDATTPQRRTAPEPQRQQPDPAADPIEAFINSRTQRTGAWLRAHRDYLTDDKKSARMNAAHYAAVAEGIELDSDRYFQYVEEKLGLKEPAKPNGDGSQPQQRRPTAPAAPVSQTAGGLNGGKREIKLSRDEAASATDGTLVWNYDDPSGKNRFKKGEPIGLQEMARRKAAMAAEGRYRNISVDGT